MKFRIHFTTPGLGDGDPGEDSIVIEGDSIEDLQKQAAAEVGKRSGTDPWSEEIKDMRDTGHSQPASQPT